MTHYVHNINPILLHLGGPFAVRWYGISYLMGFVAAILLLRRWSRKGGFQVPVHEVGNFVVMLGFFGVFLGGRLGYVLFYGFNEFLNDPLYVFKVWEGGMASHGGMVGTILFMLWYARRHKLAFWNLADNMACTASLGIAFGRLANFVNGELWGRVTTMPWGMIFPEERGLRYGEYTVDQVRAMNLPARHPSQIYEAACEGLLVFALMLLLRRTAWARREGALSASYLVLYAIARIAVEFFREPDSAIYFGWLTKGQLFSMLMVLGAAAILWKNRLWKIPSSSPTPAS